MTETTLDPTWEKLRRHAKRCPLCREAFRSTMRAHIGNLCARGKKMWGAWYEAFRDA